MPKYKRIDRGVRDKWQTILDNFCRDLCKNPTKWSFSYFLLLTHEYIQISSGGEHEGCFDTSKGKRNVTLNISTTKAYFRGKIDKQEDCFKVNSCLFLFKSLADSIRHESMKISLMQVFIEGFLEENYTALMIVIKIMFPEDSEVYKFLTNKSKLAKVFNKSYGFVVNKNCVDACYEQVKKMMLSKDKNGYTTYTIEDMCRGLEARGYPEDVINSAIVNSVLNQRVSDTV